MLYNCDELTFRFLEVSEFQHEDGEFDVEARAYGAISYKKCGEAHFEFSDGTRFSANGGDVLYIPAGVSYKVKYRGSESTVIHLLDASYTEKEVVRPKNTAKLDLAFTNLKRAWEEGHSHNLAKSGVYLILELIRCELEEGAEDSEFRKCRKYFEENFTRVDFSVEEAAKQLHISPSSLRRAFRMAVGASPIEYLTELRMKKAVELIINTTHPIKQISLECGYGDEKYFSRAFKKKYGHPPSAFSASI